MLAKEKEKRIIERVYEYKQEHIFRFWKELSDEARCNLLSQVSKIDFELLDELIEKHIIKPKESQLTGKMKPADVISIPKTEDERKKAIEAKKIGEEALRRGEVGILLVAGGQSTRLGYKGPKGTYPISPITRKSLYQLHAEKILALSKKYGVNLCWYIMTSETTHSATQSFFMENQFFQLKEDQVFFLKQGMMPSVDFEGRLILCAKDRIFMSPNGHGGVIPALKESGALNDMEKRGITQLFYFQVDNPLVKIADSLFIGYHLIADADMSTKVVTKENPEEKVGVLGYVDGKLCVIEYSELSRDEKYARGRDGELKFNSGNTAIHMLKADFIRKEIEKGFKLPYHAAKKKIPYIDERGNLVEPDEPNGLKFETFIFDALRDAKRSITMKVIREEEFYPLKNKEGVHSPEDVREALVNLYANWCEAAGMKIPRDEEGKVKGLIEVSPLFALDKEDFIKKVNSSVTFNGKLYFA